MVAKTKKPKKDIDLLQQDIASFASSLGLSSSAPHSGFDDTDFRKTGPLKPNKPVEKPPKSEPKNSHVEDNQKKQINQSEKRKKHKFDKWKKKKVEKFPVPPPIPIKQSDASKNLPKLPLMKASSLGVWYVEATELEAKVLEKEGKKIEVENYDEWTKLGERLLAQYVTDFEKSRGNSSDIKLLMTTQRSGTEADKVSAFAVLIGENPIANVRSLDALLGMVTSKVGKRHALTGFDTLKELFLSSLLPDRKLKSMLQRPLNHLPESKDGYSLLLFWYWEECLKQRYERFVSALEEASRDMLPILKDKALKTMYHLLMRKSEQERKLLSVLVNKLGDPENKGASNAEYYLSNLLKSHPGMKVVVIDEVDTFLFRPHLGQRAQYHAVNFLTQIHLTNKGDGPKVAKRLVDVYFALFKVLISDAGADEKSNKKNRDDKKVLNSRRDGKAEMPVESNVEMDSRILSALLTGVDRAFPYVTSDEADDVVEVQTPMLFKLVHSKNFNVGIRALMLLDKIASKNLVVSDRFFRAFYSKLLLPTAMNSSKVEMLFGLLNRAMKSDVNLKRVAAFSKRLLQVALQQPPHLICGCLYFLSEVLKARPPLWNMVLQTESVDEDIEHFQDINEDPENELETASTKILGNTDGTVCNINNNTTDEHDYSSDSDVKNDFRDETDDDSDESDNLVRGSSFSDVAEVATSDIGKEQPSVSNVSSLPGGYEPRHREPSYCKAERASWWELMVLSTHVHPSVATMARTLLSGANIVYNGNPLKDLSLTAFLDKFMEKKPKQTTWHGGSEIEPVKKLDTNNHLIGAEILSLTEEDVPPEDVIFHKFYMNKMNSSSKSKEKKKKKKKTAEDEAAEDLFGMNGVNESDEEIGDDVSDDEEIDKMLDSGDISTEADGGYDYDDLDKFADEYDEDLIGNDSNSETDLPSDIGEEEDDEEEDDDDVEIGNADDISDDDDDDIVEIGDVDDVSGDGDNLKENKRKRHKNSRRKPGTSPFASLEEYDHLLNEDTPKKSSSKKKKILNGDAPKRSSSKKKEILNEDAPKRSNSKKKKIFNEDLPKRSNLRKKRRKSE